MDLGRFDITMGGLIVPVALIILCTALRVQDCLKDKRSFLKSTIISSFILSINWVFAFVLFLGFGLFGIYLESIMSFVPLYLYWVYFIFSFVSFLFLFSEFYKFGHKFYQNFRDEGIFSSKARDYTKPGNWH
jgi:hypothetical protein